jgi:aminocarboxymuconate-semialdehyde decarboxylase
LPRFREKFGSLPYMELRKPGLNGCAGQMVWDDGRFIRNVEENLWDEEVRMKECDARGVDVQVISTVPAMFSYAAQGEHGLEVAKVLNDHIAAVCDRHPSRFVGLGTLPMQSPKLAMRELDRCMGDLGLAGVQIGSHVGPLNLSDPALFEVFQAAENLGAAIFVHPWDMMGEARMPKYWLPWLVAMPAEVSLAISSMIFGGVFERLPELRCCFAHGGGSFPATIGRIDQGYRARPDLCAVDNDKLPSSYLGRFFVDSLAYDPRAFRLVREVIGDHRICLGSDYPFPLGEEQPGRLIEALELEDSIKRRYFFENALEWLGLSAAELQLS